MSANKCATSLRFNLAEFVRSLISSLAGELEIPFKEIERERESNNKSGSTRSARAVQRDCGSPLSGGTRS